MQVLNSLARKTTASDRQIVKRKDAYIRDLCKTTGVLRRLVAKSDVKTNSSGKQCAPCEGAHFFITGWLLRGQRKNIVEASSPHG